MRISAYPNLHNCNLKIPYATFGKPFSRFGENAVIGVMVSSYQTELPNLRNELPRVRECILELLP